MLTVTYRPFIPDIDQPAGDNQNEPYVPFYRYLLSQDEADLPQVISLSYGDIEDVRIPHPNPSLTPLKRNPRESC